MGLQDRGLFVHRGARQGVEWGLQGCETGRLLCLLSTGNEDNASNNSGGTAHRCSVNCFKGLCHEMNIFLRLIILNRYFLYMS
jgi:hypothetical protein